jgi:hypothetical protein
MGVYLDQQQILSMADQQANNVNIVGGSITVNNTIKTTGAINSAVLMVNPLGINGNITLSMLNSSQVLTVNTANLSTITVPKGLLPGFRCTVLQLGTGNTVLTPQNVTFSGFVANANVQGQYASIGVYAYQQDTYILFGGTTPTTLPPPPPPPPAPKLNWYQYPGADGRYWKLPLQTTAKWITTGPLITSLRQGTPNVRMPPNFCVPWVIGQVGDPDCTITDGTKTITAKVPVGTRSENLDTGDNSLGGTDSTRPYLGWTGNGILIDGSSNNAVSATGGNALTDGVNLSQAQVNAIASAINVQQQAEVPGGEPFSGTYYPQNFLVGDVIIATAAHVQSSGIVGSLTDKDGTVWALHANVTFQGQGPAWWWGGITRNGASLPRADGTGDGYGGYFIALRKLNDGTVWVEEAKGGGWWSLTAANETPVTSDGTTVAFDSFTRPVPGGVNGGGPSPGAGPNNISGTGSVITCTQGLQIYDCTGPVMEDAFTGMTFTGASDNAIGNLPEFELLAAVANNAYVPPHTVACSLDFTQMAATGGVWPVSGTDTGGTGPIPEGVTIGIPYNIPKPTGKSRGFNFLWDIMTQHGLYAYNVNGSGAISIETFPISNATIALSNDMNASFPAVMANAAILAFDGSSGSQTGPNTAKGMIAGVRADAFPAPLLIDLSPTGNVHVLPSTFNAWYATQLGQFYNTPGGSP